MNRFAPPIAGEPWGPSDAAEGPGPTSLSSSRDGRDAAEGRQNMCSMALRPQ